MKQLRRVFPDPPEPLNPNAVNFHVPAGLQIKLRGFLHVNNELNRHVSYYRGSDSAASQLTHEPQVLTG